MPSAGRAPRVLHLVTWLRPGGIEKWLLTMLGEVPRSVCEMDVACKGRDVGTLADEALSRGASVLHCRLSADHVRFARRLGRILEEGRYDLLHNHLESYSGLPVLVARRVGVPVITSFHNTRRAAQTWTRLPGLRHIREIYSRMSVRYAVQHSTLVTGCSGAALASVNRGYRQRPNHRVLRYGIAMRQALAPEVGRERRRALGWSPYAPIVLHVGRFLEQKNHHGLLDIFERVRSEVPAARLVLVGDGPLRKRIQDEVKSRGLDNSIEFLGLRSDVRELMDVSDVFLFPSLYEGFGLVAIEASASGLPVVASRVPGLEEAVVDGTSGRLHEPSDVAGMARSVVELLTDHGVAERIRESARVWARQTWSVQASARGLLDLYREVVT